MTRPQGVLSIGAVLAALVGVASPGHAQGRDLTSTSIEDLMKIEITSASRKEQRAADVAAAVFVITHEDIRRSGMTTLPDVLRLAPGVDVAQVNANKWAVSVRGFNALYANKLLVLIDGRNLYNRIFSGVLWDTEDLLLADIERIEVIRGPGAALWGANAVNAVINIVTRTAVDTQGALVSVETGRAGSQGAVRYGGISGKAAYRVYSQWTGRDQSLTSEGTRADDASHSVTSGFRADWAGRPNAFTLEGSFTAGQARALWPNLDPQTAASEPIANEPTDTQGGHLRARWSRTRSNGATLQIQSSLEIGGRQEPIGDYHHRAFDIDSQYHVPLGTHQDLVAGTSYRFTDEQFLGTVGLSLTPPDDHSSLWAGFVQDEIALANDRLAITLGTQIQYDSTSGAGVQPTARVMWKGLSSHRFWAAASRALRTPALNERGIRVDYPPVAGPGGLPLYVSALGNPLVETETLGEAEVGYRLEIGTTASVDVTGFTGRYEHLATQEVSAPIVEFVPSPRIVVASHIGNALDAATHGVEIAGHWAPLDTWHLDGSYSTFHFTPRLAATSQDPNAGSSDATAPSGQWQLRTTFAPARRMTIGAALFHVGPLVQLQVAAYTRADVNAEWRFTPRLSLMVIGQNLLDAAHAEFAGTASLLLPTQVPRSASLRLRWMSR